MTEALPYIGGIILAIVTFLLGRKKLKVDTQKTELDSVEQAVKIWRQLATDMNNEMEKWKELAIKLEEEVKELRDEVDRLRKIINHEG
jgi:gas vesicle protein